MRPRQRKESGRGGGEVLMQNKVSVLFVSLRPSQAIFVFFFQIESVHDGYFFGSSKKPQLLFLRKKAELSYFGEL